MTTIAENVNKTSRASNNERHAKAKIHAYQVK